MHTDDDYEGSFLSSGSYLHDVENFNGAFGLHSEMMSFTPSLDALGVFSFDDPFIYEDTTAITQQTENQRFSFRWPSNENNMDTKPTHNRSSHSPPNKRKRTKVEDFELVIERQPPVEVRTRTPSENRTFSVMLSMRGSYIHLNIAYIRARLVYANGSIVVKKKKEVLGGDLRSCIGKDEKVSFTNLSICEASTKHGEQEFCIEFAPVSLNDVVLHDHVVRSSPFYAYSHMKVLARRKNIWLRTLNKNFGSFHGGEEMHVIGTPFIKGPSLKCVFDCKQYGKIPALDLEVYSESVLFFRSPAYPDLSILQSLGNGGEIAVAVLVTNDGRTYSNILEFRYVADSNRWY